MKSGRKFTFGVKFELRNEAEEAVSVVVVFFLYLKLFGLY